MFILDSCKHVLNNESKWLPESQYDQIQTWVSDCHLQTNKFPTVVHTTAVCSKGYQSLVNSARLHGYVIDTRCPLNTGWMELSIWLMDQFSLPALGAAAAVLGGLLFYYRLSSSQKKRLPPGPRRLPGIGNVHQMPTKAAWLVFAKWGETYGTKDWYF